MFKKNIFTMLGFTLVSASVILTGCSTPVKYETHKQMFATGLYKESIAPFEEEMVKRQKKAGLDEEGNPLPVPGARAFSLDDMEMGAAYRVMGELENSNDSFQRAEEGIRAQQEAFAIRNAGGQIAAVFANDNMLPYQIQEYDSIMVNTYKALNLLEQGEIDKTRVEFNRVNERQRMAAVRFQKEIAEAKAAEEANQEAVSVEGENEEKKEEGGIKGKIKGMIAEKFQEAKKVVMGSMVDGENKAKLDEYKNSFNADVWGAEDVFTNPFATYMRGLFLLAYGEDMSDAESAAHALETACRIEPNPEKNPAAIALTLASDIANQKINKDSLKNKVFVIFENGVGPEKQEYTIPLIIPLDFNLNSKQRFVDATLILPKLVSRDEAFPYLSLVSGGEKIANTSIVCNMDSVVAAEFRERMPAIILRNVLQSGVKAVLQAMIVDALAKNDIPPLVASAAVSAIFNSTKAADLRIWASLPKNFQVAIIDRPQSGELQLFAPEGEVALATVEIPEQCPAFVFVKTPAANVPVKVSVVPFTTVK